MRLYQELQSLDVARHSLISPLACSPSCSPYRILVSVRRRARSRPNSLSYLPSCLEHCPDRPSPKGATRCTSANTSTGPARHAPRQGPADRRGLAASRERVEKLTWH